MNLTLHEQRARDPLLPPEERLSCILQLARMVRDPGEVLAYAEQAGLRTSSAAYQLALAEQAQNEGDLARALDIIETALKKNSDESDLLWEHTWHLQQRIEQVVLEQASHPRRRMLRDRDSQRCQRQPRINGSSHLQFNGCQVFVDSAYRKYYRGKQLIQAFRRDCLLYMQERKDAFLKQLHLRPYSWISRQLKPYRMLDLDSPTHCRPSDTRFSTPNRPKHSRGLSKAPPRDTSFVSRTVDSPQLLRELFRKSPSFPNRQATRIVAVSPPRRPKQNKTQRTIECLRLAVEEEFSFSEFNRAMIDGDDQSSSQGDGLLSSIIRESQNFYHARPVGVEQDSLEDILGRLNEEKETQSWQEELELTFASRRGQYFA